MKLTDDDMINLIKLQFHMVAHTAKEMFDAKNDVSPFKISSVVDGLRITAVIGVEKP